MRSFETLSLALVAAQAWTVAAAPSSKKHIHAEVKRYHNKTIVHNPPEQLIVHNQPNLGKRGDVLSGIKNDIKQAYLYLASVGIGNPWQSVWLWIDTGSFDTWVYNPSLAAKNNCTTGSFNPSQSKTYQAMGQSFSDGYIGASVSGQYFKDQFSIGGSYLGGFQQGLASQSTSFGGAYSGILGLNANEGADYPILPEAMKNAGLTETAAFTVYLNDVRAPTGDLLFGAYDETKYTGNWGVMPWNLAVTGLTLKMANGTTEALKSQAMPFRAIIDTGAATTGIPPDIWAPIANYFGITCQNLLWCDQVDPSAELLWRMGNTVTITMPFSQMLIPLYNSDGSVLTQGGRAVCSFALTQGSMGENFLGDSFLRNAYTIYDADRQQVAMAQAVFNKTGSTGLKIVDISPNGNLLGVPSVTTIPFASAPTNVKSGVCGN